MTKNATVISKPTTNPQ